MKKLRNTRNISIKTDTEGTTQTKGNIQEAYVLELWCKMMMVMMKLIQYNKFVSILNMNLRTTMDPSKQTNITDNKASYGVK